MSIVTEGILNMPFDLAMGDEFMRRQYYSTVRAEIARLQEQVETQRKERDVAVAAMVRNNNRSEAAEAERDRLREALQAMLSNPDKLSRAQARAALQKEPQP